MEIKSLSEWKKQSPDIFCTKTQPLKLLQTYQEWLREHPKGYVCCVGKHPHGSLCAAS
jgi:hypothetical protein